MKNRPSKSRDHALSRKAIGKSLLSWQNLLPSRINRKFVWFLPSCFLLTLLTVTQGIPALALQPTLTEPTQIVQQVSNPTEMLQQGKNYYQAGQLTQAANYWQQALNTYQAQGEIIGQIQTQNYLALAYKELGQIESAQAAITDSLNLLKSLPEFDGKSSLLSAQALNTQGTIQLLQGQTETALETWKQAAKTYELAGDSQGKLISTINQAQALQTLGQYRQAKSQLEKLAAQLQAEPDTLLKAQGLRSLGIALQTVGDLIQSKEILEQSWNISKKLKSPADISAALFSIGNVASDLGKYDVAWTYYQEATKVAPDLPTKLEAQLNQLSILINLQRWVPALELIPEIETNLAQAPASRPAIYSRINLAESLMKYEKGKMKDGKNYSSSFTVQTANLLATAIQQARQIKDARAEAYSLYQLGKIYKSQGNLTDAKTLTEQALQIAQKINAADIVARAAGQLGGISKQQGEVSKAITAYEIAFNNLQSLRSDLVAINSDVQFDFKESIEPIYRDLVSLLLQQDNSQANLKEARDVMEALQLAELDNFFQDACLDTYPVAIDEIDVQAAVIYPIILPDRLEVILSVPNQPLENYTTQLPQEEVEKSLQRLYSSFSPAYPRQERLQLAQQVYKWLIEPAETTIEKNNIKTLVFVPDGFLRNLPIAALYDGQNYLLEKYRTVFSPGLQLFPQGLSQEPLKVLAAGLAEARQGFEAIPGVTKEIQQVTAEIDSKVLLNQAFTSDRFKEAIDNQEFPIVHLATHGQFSSNPEETFLLTWNDRISMEDFDLLFQKRRLGILKPIELLVMSACQTAAGDNRASLGLSGFALRSGAKSTIGSLWPVSDEATANLMIEFYHQLTNGKVSKAEALRQAQLKTLANPSYKHPYFWSAFILIGNWL